MLSALSISRTGISCSLRCVLFKIKDRNERSRAHFYNFPSGRGYLAGLPGSSGGLPTASK